jgi:tripartite-type tricarboxylate transporter receptor subunit TctC
MRILVGMIAALVSLCGSQCDAQTWPDHHVSLVVPFAAGSAIDVVARIVSAEMSQHLGQPVIVENIGGAGGTVGVAHVAKAPRTAIRSCLERSTHLPKRDSSIPNRSMIP